ncbi:NEW3 domain-containing protein [Microbacterium sp. M]|uniref:NEW3 domain-containing protein n=1 Tax=Microbacterium sp. M TaxID=3377125 RepID=UPI00386FA1BA
MSSLERAQELVRQATSSGVREIVVSVAAGDYRLDEPLVFDGDDSAAEGGSVSWVGPARGEARVLGTVPVTGWELVDQAAGIYSAAVPEGTRTRQLYVDGVLAERAKTELTRGDMPTTEAGYKPKGSAAWLLELPGVEKAEIKGSGSWTSRISPIAGVERDTLVMEQPAWKLNTWGWDTLDAPFHAGPLVVENSLAFLDEPGEWFLDDEVGRLYYKPLDDQRMDRAAVELPHLESLVQVAGTLDEPVHGLSFSGLTFSGTTWNAPTTIGFADQQTGSYLADIEGADLTNFESTRGLVSGMPAAVEVTAASDIAFSESRFVNLGANGLGIGNDANATASGVGLAAQRVTVERSEFTEIGGTGVAVGGYLPDAHHPSDPRMTVSEIVVRENVIHEVARYYTDNVGVLLTYAADSTISHNEISDLPYSAIATGYGWGMVDAGGSAEYERRGTYNYYPRYETPTTLHNLTVEGNHLHDVLGIHYDGAPYYNLGASPGSVFRGNYVEGAGHGWGYGLYFDEGSRFIEVSGNVVTAIGRWWHANYSNSPLNGDMVTTGNFSNIPFQNAEVAGRRSVYTDNTVVPDENWPMEARRIIYEAGIAPLARPDLPDFLRDVSPATAAVYFGAAPEHISIGGEPVSIPVEIGNASQERVTSLSVKANLPQGWEATVSDVPRSLEPGATATATIALSPSKAGATPITSAEVAIDAKYRIGTEREKAQSTITALAGSALAEPLVSFTTSPVGITGQQADLLAIQVAGTDIWQDHDEYGAIYQPDGLGEYGSVTVFLEQQDPVDEYTKSGVVIRNDLTDAGEALGYASVYRIAGHGVALAVDTDGDGNIDREDRASVSTTGPIGLRLVRAGATVTGFVSEDSGETWKAIGTARDLIGADENMDAGVIHTSHNASLSALATFRGLSIEATSGVVASAPTQVSGSAGAVVDVPIAIRNLSDTPISGAEIVAVPSTGWTAAPIVVPGTIEAGQSVLVSAVLTPPAGAIATGRVDFTLRYDEDVPLVTPEWSTSVGAGASLPDGLSAFTTSPSGLVGGGAGGSLGIRVAGADIWGAGGQRDDAYGTVFVKDAITGDGSVTARLDAQERANDYTKSGVVIRNDLTAARSGTGYASLYRLAGFGVALAVDTDGDGFIDVEHRMNIGSELPILLRLQRADDQVSGWVSRDDGATWVQVGPAAALMGAEEVLDAGVIHTSHDAGRATSATFSGLTIAE